MVRAIGAFAIGFSIVMLTGGVIISDFSSRPTARCTPGHAVIVSEEGISVYDRTIPCGESVRINLSDLTALVHDSVIASCVAARTCCDPSGTCVPLLWGCASSDGTGCVAAPNCIDDAAHRIQCDASRGSPQTGHTKYQLFCGDGCTTSYGGSFIGEIDIPNPTVTYKNCQLDEDAKEVC